jgi:hypothetical protein
MKIVVVLYHNYDTEAYARYDEEVESTKKIGSLYIKKLTYKQLGEPRRIKVTIEPNE